jgi:hypothetical protein
MTLGLPTIARATATLCCWPPRAGWGGAWRDGHADALEGFLDAFPALRRRHAAIGQGQLHVLEDGEVADQVEALEDEPDVAVADARAPAEIKILNGLARDGVGPTGRRVEQAEDGQQRGLAAARGSRDGHVFALGDVEMDPRQGVGLDFVRVEDLGQALEADKGSGRVHRSPCAGRVVPAFIL